MKKISLEEAKQCIEKYNVLYVVNLNKVGGFYSPTHVSISLGNKEENVLIDATFAPIDMSMICDLTALLASPTFRRALGKELVAIVDREWAVTERRKPEVINELNRILGARQLNATTPEEEEKPSARVLGIMMREDSSPADKLQALKTASDVLTTADYNYVLKNSKDDSVLKYVTDKLGRA